MSKQSTKRLKVLLCCYACDPHAGSEPGGGWNFLKCVSQYHDVHVLVEEGKFKSPLLEYSKQHPEQVQNITFHFIYRKRARLLRKIWPPSYYTFYKQWQKKAYQYALELDKKEHFDIVHQVNMAGYRVPGYLWKLGKPFVWGPICGFTTTPWNLLLGAGLHRILYFGMRNIINFFQKRWGYAARIASQKAHAIFISDPSAVNEIKRLWNVESLVMREVGTHKTHHSLTPTKHNPNSPLKICWIGLMIPRKAVDLILRAIPYCQQAVQLELIGDGEMKYKWERLAQRLGIMDRVIFHGKIPFDQVSAKLQKCHVFCITSIHEGGTPTVVMEAMENGLPIVALNHCGYATAIDDSCGIRVPLGSKKHIAQHLAKAFDHLATHEEHRYNLGLNAIQHSKSFLWNNKAMLINEVYQKLINN